MRAKILSLHSSISIDLMQTVVVEQYSTFQVGCLREAGSNGEIGIRSIDAKITQTTNPIVNMTKTIGLWLMLF